MKTKMMKRTLSTIIALIMVLSLFSGLTVSAETTDPTVEYLFYEDFEGQTENNAPTGFYKDDSTHKYTYADENKTAVGSEYAFIRSDTTHGNYLEIAPTSTDEQERAKVFLSEPVDSSDGTIVIEYDGLININGNGNNGSKYIFATFTGTGKDRTKISKQHSAILYNGGEKSTGENLGIKETVYTAYSTSFVDRYKGTSVDRLLYYYNDKTGAASGNEANCMKRKDNTWQHYKMELNLADGTQQLWIDGKASEIWLDKELYTKIKHEGYSIDAISFMNYKSSTTNWLFDNIKVYKKDTAATSPFSGDITQAATGVVTANFTSAMSKDGIALYDADGNDVTKSVSLTNDGKTATITPNKSTQGLYYVKVGTYAGGTVPAQTEKTVELNWEMEPTAYLLNKDFENDEIGKAPTDFYKDDSTHKYTYADEDKTAVGSEYAFISSDTTHGNYLEIAPTSTDEQERAKVFLSEPVDSSDGTIVIEYDGLININGNGNNGSKYIFATFTGTGKDRTKISKQYSAILYNGGESTGENLGIKETVYTAYSTSFVDRYKGTSVDRLLYYYNDKTGAASGNEANCMKRKDNTWQHYKMELNLADGTQQLWIDGKASEIWLDKELYTKIKHEGYSIDAISFMNYKSSTTNWLFDNIKVYKKDTADTSPFETITSEKNGDVTVKFGYAVNAEDLSVYNADGEKINGKFVMSDGNKTATFTPNRIEDDGLYYVKVAKLASGTVTSQTTKEFTYKPGRTKMVISGLDKVAGSITPTFTLTHTDGTEVEIIMIVAAYKDDMLVKADVKTKSLTTTDETGVVEENVPTITLAEGDADTVKAFAWIGGTNVPIGDAAVYPTAGNN